MMPKIHVFAGLVGAVGLWLVFDVGWFFCLVFWGASFLIDVDHYFFYVWSERNWSLWKAFKLFLLKKKKYEAMNRKERKKVMKGFWVLHGLEWVLLFGVFGYFIWNMFYFVALGFLFHLVLDWVDIAIQNGRWDKVFVVWDWKKFKRLGKL
jgi:hypothetical protein